MEESGRHGPYLHGMINGQMKKSYLTVSDGERVAILRLTRTPCRARAAFNDTFYCEKKGWLVLFLRPGKNDTQADSAHWHSRNYAQHIF